LVIASRQRDFAGGLLMLVIGAGAAWQGRSYNIGTLRRMGPGFFPTALGVLLAIVGVALMVAAGRAAGAPGAVPGRPEWRGWFCISAGIVAFCLLGSTVGLLPATTALVFIAALGDRDNSILAALTLAIVIDIAGVVVFWWALQLQFPLLMWPTL